MATDGAEYFPARLRELRQIAALGQKDVADRVGLTVRQISRLETGANVPTWPTVIALADALGVSTEAFRQPPTTTSEPPGRGRPPKQQAEEPATPKRPRGRPKKDQGKVPMKGKAKKGGA